MEWSQRLERHSAASVDLIKQEFLRRGLKRGNSIKTSAAGEIVCVIHYCPNYSWWVTPCQRIYYTIQHLNLF